MSMKHRIVTADLDDRSRSAVEGCLPPDHFEITSLDQNERPAIPERVDLVIFRAADDTEPTRELCDSLRRRVGRGVPLIACVGRYVYPLIRPLLGGDIQSLIITPFTAAELRQKLDELDLEF